MRETGISLDELESKGIDKTHIQCLKKFHLLKDQVLESNQLCGKRKQGSHSRERLPADSIVSKPHYLHNLVRGVYKPAKDPFALAIYTNPESEWGQEVNLGPDSWTVNYDFGQNYKHPEDIDELRKCADQKIPFGVIARRKKGFNVILGLGKVSKIKSNRFSIVPIELDLKTKAEIDNAAYARAQREADVGDYSCPGTLVSTLGRQKTKLFREKLFHEYDRRCAFCGLSVESLLVSSHIVALKIMREKDPQNAMNPSDGLLLCKLCDKAFEDGDIQVTATGKIIISSKLAQETSDRALNSWRSCIADQISIKQDSKHRPNEYLRWKLRLEQHTS